jgi:hypothetical protein
MKGSNNFKKVIEIYLNQEASVNSEFHSKFHDSKKNIEDCIKYILNTVQASGCNGFAEKEIYDMALFYYQNDVEVKDMPQGSVVVNHHVELTPEEIAEAKQQAINKVIEEEKKRIKAKPTVSAPQTPQITQGSLF